MIFCNAVLVLKSSVGESDVQCMLLLNGKIKIYVMAPLNSLFEVVLCLKNFVILEIKADRRADIQHTPPQPTSLQSIYISYK